MWQLLLPSTVFSHSVSPTSLILCIHTLSLCAGRESVFCHHEPELKPEAATLSWLIKDTYQLGLPGQPPRRPCVYPSITIQLVFHFASIRPGHKVKESEGENHSVMSDSLQSHGLYSQWNSPSQDTGVRSLSLLKGIFPTQGANLGLLQFRRSLCQLSLKGSPRIL